MINHTLQFTLDGQSIPFVKGQTLLQAATTANIYIPHLCYHPNFKPHGSCKVCDVQVNGRVMSACSTQAVDGMMVECRSDKMEQYRREILRMLFVEGNHFCPGCEKTGSCTLQALAYDAQMMSPHYNHFFPNRPVDASHPDILLDFNRCIMCELCVRASREIDGKNVFALIGRGMQSHIVVNSPSGLLVDSDINIDDCSANICPVGAILKKGLGFAVPIGERQYDEHTIAEHPISFQTNKPQKS